MKILLLTLLLPFCLTRLSAEEKPPHTFDVTLGLGKLIFASTPEELKASGLELTHELSLLNGGLSRWRLHNTRELGLREKQICQLFFVDGMLYRIRILPDPELDLESSRDELDRFWARFTSTRDMQPSHLFRFDARQRGERYAEFAINAKALDALQEARVNQAAQNESEVSPLREGF